MRGAAPKIYLIQVSAIPGTGKSSALRRLEETGMLAERLQMRVAYVQEPVELWREQGWLQDFYANPSHTACAFQLLVFDSHIAAVERAITTTSDTPLVLVVERSMYDQHLFWDVQVEQKYPSTDAIHQAAYHRLWLRWRSFVPEPSLVVFMKTSNIQMTMQRLASRARPEEVTSTDDSTSIESVSGLTLEYQSRLYAKHCEWFTEPVARPPYLLPETQGIPCTHIVVDAPYHVHDDPLAELADQLALAIRAVVVNE